MMKFKEDNLGLTEGDDASSRGARAGGPVDESQVDRGGPSGHGGHCQAGQEASGHGYDANRTSRGIMAVVGDGTPSTGSRISAVTEERHSKVGYSELARRWRISLDSAKQTLKTTTQIGVRTAVHPLTRRYKTGLIHGHNARRLQSQWFTDTLFSKFKSLNGNTCAQLFTDTGMVTIHPAVSKSAAGDCLEEFIDEVGIPSNLLFDGASEHLGPNTTFMKAVKKHAINWRVIEPHSHWQNRAEDMIKKVKHRWKTTQSRIRCSPRLWDYGIVHEARLLSRIAKPHERPPLEAVLGDSIDLSEYLDFDFYDPVWFWEPNAGEKGERQIGRWLGISHRVGSAMCYWVLNSKGNVLARSTVQHVTKEELRITEADQQLQEFDVKVAEKMKDKDHVVKPSAENRFFHPDVDMDMEDPAPELEDNVDEADGYDEDTYDTFLGGQLMLEHKGQLALGTVTKRAKGEDGNPIGKHNANPLFDTRKFEVEFPDGDVQEYYANVIAENLFSQVDSEGRQMLLMESISDHKKDEQAIKKEHWKGGPTTKGWKLLVQWKDGTEDWIPLKDLKESNPVEVAEYSVANKIDEEPAFRWWVRKVLRRKRRIISKVKSRYWRTTHKFGIRLPHSVKEAYEIDDANGNTFWRDAIQKEMKKIKGLETFEKLEGVTPEMIWKGQHLMPGYTEIGCHMVFDIKMDGKFTRKARFVANGHETGNVPKHDTYASVVSRDSVRMAFLYAALNDLDILSCDIANAYLNAPCTEKIWTVAGPEFGSDAGSVMIIKKAAYGLKSAGSSWAKTLAGTLSDLGFFPSRADPCIHMRRNSRDGEDYWEWIVVYVDDLMAISHDPDAIMKGIAASYDLKDTVKPPERYLGANIGKWQLSDGREVWCMSGQDYVKNAVKLAKDLLEQKGMTMTHGKKSARPMPQNYRPELDISAVLSPKEAQEYQQFIGIARWAVELGRIDILYEVSLLSSHLAMPRKGHMEALMGIFAYLEKHPRATLVFDDRYPGINDTAPDTDWLQSIYGKGEEELPPKMPEPLGKPVYVTAMVDASHGGDKLTFRSHTGILIYMNNSPIEFYSKRQNTVETSTFGAELVAGRVAMEKVRAYRTKLRLLGVPIGGVSYMLCDNQSVVTSTGKAESTLTKKHNSICWHSIREAISQGWMKILWEPTDTNLADLFTKSLPTERRKELLRQIYQQTYEPEPQEAAGRRKRGVDVEEH